MRDDDGRAEWCLFCVTLLHSEALRPPTHPSSTQNKPRIPFLRTTPDLLPVKWKAALESNVSPSPFKSRTSQHGDKTENTKKERSVPKPKIKKGERTTRTHHIIQRLPRSPRDIRPKIPTLRLRKQTLIRELIDMISPLLLRLRRGINRSIPFFTHILQGFNNPSTLRLGRRGTRRKCCRRLWSICEEEIWVAVGCHA